MYPTLLEQFLREECTPYVLGLLRSAIDAARASPSSSRKLFEFDRFNIMLDLETGAITVQDICDPSDTGEQKVSLEEFSAALELHRAQPSQ